MFRVRRELMGELRMTGTAPCLRTSLSEDRCILCSGLVNLKPSRQLRRGSGGGLVEGASL